MASETTNISTDDFLPAKSSKKAGQKRTISVGNDDQMQIDEVTGIEGVRKTNAPKSKKKKTNVEIRKIPVPSHRFVINTDLEQKTHAII